MNPSSEPFSLLRTAVGSPPSVSQLEYFRKLGVRIVAADCDPLSVGLFVADRAVCVPRASAPNYIQSLIELCERERVTAFLPALDEELLQVDAAREQFARVGTAVLLSPRKTLEICTDKLLTYRFFSDHGHPTVATLSFAEACANLHNLELPVIVKPRRGRGSSNVFVARSPEQLSFFLHYVSDPVVQPLITGSEYTIDVLADWNSEAAVIAPRLRIDTDSGISSKGRLSWDETMVESVRKMTRDLRLIGPANIQCFVSVEGNLIFTEVNARLAGTSILTAAAKIPLYEGILSMFCGQNPPVHAGPPQDVVMMRYWSELYVTSDEARAFGWTGTR